MTPCNECPLKYKEPLVRDVQLHLDPVPEPVKAAAVRTAPPKPTTMKIREMVLFDFDSYTLDSEADYIVMKVASLMKHYPDTIIKLEGHTDKVGTVNYNQTLSENRANAVKDALVESGVADNRIAGVRGFGKSQLIPNLTDRENRRVLILSIGDK